MKRFLTVIFLSCVISTVNAQSFTVGCLNYSVNDNGYSVTVTGHVDGTEAEGSIDIPNMVPYNGRNYLVTAIGQNAFASIHSLHGTLTIGDNVTDIGSGAFCNCDSLTGNLIIPNSVTHIGPYAFRNCDCFTGSLTIPNSVVSIDHHAFDRCDGFYGTLTIGSSVTNIGSHAFALCPYFIEAISLATEPPHLDPVLGPDSAVEIFYGFGCSTLTVPCGSEEAYENSPWKTTHGIAGVVLSYGFDTILQDCESEDEYESASTAVYPNPNNGSFYVSLSNNEDEITCIRVFDITGKTIYSNNSFNDGEIVLPNAKQGLYYVVVTLKNKTITEKIIIQ